jgi:predicted nucleic acid-binding protein
MAAHRAHRFRVSLVTWAELAEGVASSADLEALLKRVRLLQLPKQVAWETSRIQRELSGQRLGENDAWIAGTARAWGLRLVTRDGAFRRVPRLDRIPY